MERQGYRDKPIKDGGVDGPTSSGYTMITCTWI